MARRHSKEGGNQIEQESNRQKTMEDTDGGLHSAIDGQILDEGDLLTYAHRSRWSIGHLRPLAIALCSGLLWPFQTSWSLAVPALIQCLASNCCEAGLSSSSPAGSRSGLACGAGCWLPEGVSDPPWFPSQYLLGWRWRWTQLFMFAFFFFFFFLL